MQYVQNTVTVKDFVRACQGNPDASGTHPILSRTRAHPDLTAVLTSVMTKLGRDISLLHNKNIVHGDLTTSNVLIQA